MKTAVEEPAIVLVPMGAVPDDLLHSLMEAVSGTFELPCRVAAPISIPSAAYDRRRGQYVGGHILTELARLEVPDAERVLGVIDADCYAPGLNFILGQASARARDAFMALPRLRQSFYGLAEDESLFRERASKEAVHELGHTYGMGHCPNPKCVMHFSNSVYDTDVKGAEFCPRCRARL